ncbi:hypothetical protein [Streptomyces yaizuensis]|uniref:Uncharacterized protein n=1 Tax=Streptomyces yaizuensis TaxID=2989713 RepID=A0ABQ5PBD4_9ACTN|nr:hypothetical protein [Streptomyces sp. YSPA8]GLF99910.1 hypothetical protein SYYSPA8_36455 [Streptomyces sp. YSPA8]
MIGEIPCHDVIREGRRRKTFRWTVGTTAALTTATGMLILVHALPGGAKENMIVQPHTSMDRSVLIPQATILAKGHEQGESWTVTALVWGAPRTQQESRRQLKAIEHAGITVPLRAAKDLIGKSWLFVTVRAGDSLTTPVSGPIDTTDFLSGNGHKTYSQPLPSDRPDQGDDSPQRLVIGKVAPQTQQVIVSWDNGMSTSVLRAPENAGAAPDDRPSLHPVKGDTSGRWFATLGPEGSEHTTTEAVP